VDAARSRPDDGIGGRGSRAHQFGYLRRVDAPHSTLTGITADAKDRIAAWGRRGFLVLVLLFVIAGLCGLLGVRTATGSADRGGYHLSLEYPRIARAGLDVPWQVTITHPGGFGGPVVLEATGSYFDIFESQGITPEPDKETQDGSWWRMTFDKPPGDTLVVSLDVYVQPASQVGRSGTVRVLDHGTPAASVDFRTSLLP
jgi:hypothetical protein